MLKEHMTMHSGEKPHRCEECGKEFCGLKPYQEHTLNHTDRLFYWCSTCKSNLSTREAYQKHKKVKIEDLLNCDYCDQVFCNNYMFKRHFHTTHTNNDVPPYECTECPALFQYVSKF